MYPVLGTGRYKENVGICSEIKTIERDKVKNNVSMKKKLSQKLSSNGCSNIISLL